MMAMFFVACDNDDDPTPEPIPDPESGKTAGLYILNSGKYKANNATLDYYDFETKTLTQKVFSTVNGRGLGDTANDMLVYGSKMYIAIDVSNTIEITDLDGKSLNTIAPKDESGQPQSPRYLAAYEGKVYVTLFDGHLACIDTTTMEITQKVKVGPNPYQVCLVGNKLYVANSGGYNPVKDSTLSVVDPVTFTEEKKVVVGLNPQSVKADGQGNLYVLCAGNFGDVKASVMQYNIDKGTSTALYSNDNLIISMNSDTLYVISSESNESTGWVTANSKFITYDAKTSKEITDNFITDGTNVEKPYCLNVDSRGTIYVGTSDYTNTGDMFIFSSEGVLTGKIAVSGINPVKACFVERYVSEED